MLHKTGSSRFEFGLLSNAVQRYQVSIMDAIDNGSIAPRFGLLAFSPTFYCTRTVLVFNTTDTVIPTFHLLCGTSSETESSASQMLTLQWAGKSESLKTTTVKSQKMNASASQIYSEGTQSKNYVNKQNINTCLRTLSSNEILSFFVDVFVDVFECRFFPSQCDNQKHQQKHQHLFFDSLDCLNRN